jgi:thiamine biosynthesis lipoprotein
MTFDKGQKLISSLPDTEALWVMKNGEIRYSANFKKFIKE